MFIKWNIDFRFRKVIEICEALWCEFWLWKLTLNFVHVMKRNKNRTFLDTFIISNIAIFTLFLALYCDFYRGTEISIIPADTDVFKMSSGRLKKVRTSYHQTRRRLDVLQKTFNLRRLEDVWLTTSWRRFIYDVLKMSVKQRPCSNVVATSIQRRKKWFFLSYSENFKRFCLG